MQPPRPRSFRRRRAALWLGAALALAATTVVRSAAYAEAQGSAPGAIVARVGSRVITASDLRRRLAAVPAFQLKAFGKTPDEIRRNFLEQVLVREALLAQGAALEGIEQREDVREKILATLRNQMLGAARAEALVESPVTEADIRAYYQANLSKFHTPARVAIWRIQVATEAEARDILEQVKRDPSPKRWNELVREKSLDKTTNMRGGNVGFVFPDGRTSEQGVKLEPSVVAAVSQVKDLELVPAPVKDGERFSVVWRRQSARAVERPLDLEMGSIRQVLIHQRTDGKVKKLLEKLRSDAVRDVHPEVLEALDVTSTGDLQAQRRPGVLSAGRRAAGSPAPKQGPSGLR
jgi:peptidyl-prolyl cis-trans isomerase C